jgi:hypothetical protein
VLLEVAAVTGGGAPGKAVRDGGLPRCLSQNSFQALLG